MKKPYLIVSSLKRAISRAAEKCVKGKSFSRKSPLTKEALIRLLIGAEGGSLDKILHTVGINVTASAVSQRRAQVTPEVFRAAFDYFNADCVDDDFFRGYRLLAADGTTVNLPRNPKAPSFVQNAGIPKGVNQLHLTPLYDILSRTFADVIIQPEPKKDEIGALITMLQRNNFSEKTLIIADRGFESYNLIAHLQEKTNVDFLIRVKQSRSAMREVAKLPMLELDCNISFSICTTQKNSDKQNQNYLQITVALKFFLMGDLFIREKFSVAIPPIEKGVDKVSEYLTEKIYDCINGELLRHNVADVEDLRLEICFMCQKCRSRFFVAGCFFTFCGGKSAVKLMISVRSQSFDKQKCTGASIITGNAASQQKFPCPIQTGQGEFLKHLAEKAIAILSVIV